MNVLSLFDGLSSGRIALERAGISVANYFASEIDKHAIKVSQDNWKDVTAIGDVTKISYRNGVLYTEVGEFNVGKIDLVIAGSPCQGFSMAGKQLAFGDERSKLYFVFERILKEIRAENPDVKFLLENVKMKQEHKDVITERLGVSPVAINSNLVSAQNRYRLYWTNICEITQPADRGIRLCDILQDIVPDKYRIKDGRLKWLKTFGEVKEKDGYVAFNPVKAKCLTEDSIESKPSWNTTYVTGAAFRGQVVKGEVEPQLNIRKDEKSNCGVSSFSAKLNCVAIMQWPHGTNSGGYRAEDGKTPTLTTSSWESNNLLLNEGMVRKLTPEECETLQTVPVGYTSCVSDSQRYKMLGNGWTVDVIAHIFKSLAVAQEERMVA